MWMVNGELLLIRKKRCFIFPYVLQHIFHQGFHPRRRDVRHTLLSTGQAYDGRRGYGHTADITNSYENHKGRLKN